MKYIVIWFGDGFDEIIHREDDEHTFFTLTDALGAKDEFIEDNPDILSEDIRVFMEVGNEQ